MRWLIFLALMLAGCTKQPVPSTPAAVVFKSPTLKVAGTGFLKRGKSLQLYNASTPLLELRLGKRVCMNGRCVSYEMFNKKFLSPSYPPTFIKNIFGFRPIFGGRNRISTAGGFEQRFENLGIIYIVLKGSLIFKDAKHHILIKIKEIDG